MSLQIGQQLGSFEITSLIGKGGMGEVYRAKDTKLKRDVAIKILPDEFSRDTDRVARFQREAESLAALNHQNIAAIYDLQQSDATRFLILEFVDGDTLADILKKRGALPVEESLHIAKQICEALEAAHEKGIVHRDLKPANVKITPDGKVKVLDFGLAKAFEAEGSQANLSQSPTLSMAATNAGVILGTAAYMSPEQAKGRQVDRRTDIFAFGCVLYEMLTARQVFAGETISDILAAVLKVDPDWNRLPEDTPAAIRRLLRRCLQKDGNRRFQYAADVRIEIEEARTEPEIPTDVASRSRERLAWTAAVVLLLAIAVTLAVPYLRETPPEQKSIRFQVAPPENAIFRQFRQSPDGRQFAFVASQVGQTQTSLWVRSLDSVDARPLTGTDGATYPFWSPDSTQIGFFAQGKLKKIAVAGGLALTLCEAVNGRGGTWNRDGVIVFTPTLNSGLYRVADGGGAPVPVAKGVDIGNVDNRFPEFLPDGQRFLFLRLSDKDGGIYVGSLDGTPAARILPDLSNSRYVAGSGQGGYLLFRRENILMAQPFDPVRVQTTGSIVPIAEQVSIAGNTGYGAFDGSEDGTIAYISGIQGGARELVWLDRTGKRLSVVTKPDEITRPALSPDGKVVVYFIGNSTAGYGDLWLQNVERGVLSRFTFGPGANAYPIWSPDNSRIVFTATPTPTTYEIHQKLATGGGDPEIVLQGPFSSLNVHDWSPDGKFIVFSDRSAKTKDDLWLLPMEGDHKPIPLLHTLSNENNGQLSPDGKWMAYQSDESGQYEIYVQHVPPNGSKFQISSTGGRFPRWRRDGKELFYLVADQKLMVVPVKLGATFEPGQGRVLFENVNFAIAETQSPFQPEPDGQRFLALLRTAGEGASASITVVTNWQAALKK